MFVSVSTVLARLMMALIFLMSAIGNKIPQFNSVAQMMEGEGVPVPKVMLVGAILFLIVGSLSLILGFRARIGASLLFVFLVLATYFFHDFWNFSDEKEQQMQMIAFMKNLALMGGLLFVMVNGSGPGSLQKPAQK